MSQSWVRKYLPKKPEDILGQEEAVRALDHFITTFKKQKKKAALLHGPPGAGKTSTVYTLAQKHNLEVVEINASDFRDAASVESLVGAASKQMSLFSRGKIILVDEVDGLSGTKDRGGIQAVVKLIDTTSFPIICTANNPWDSKFKSLRTACLLVPFEPLSASTASLVLKMICEKEGLAYEETALKTLVRKTSGDLRAAINDLQGLSQLTKKITLDALNSVDERNKIETIEQALVKVFKNSDPMIALSAFDTIEEDLEEVMLWIDYNLPKEYTKPADLMRAMEHLSKADVYNGRIKRWQHWRFLVYIGAHLSAGVATAKDEKYSGLTPYEQTKRILTIWMANMKYQKRKAIAAKIAEKTHTSTARVIQTTIPYLQNIYQHNNQLAAQLSEEFSLDPEEVAWLKK